MILKLKTFCFLVHLCVLCMGGDAFRSDYTYYSEASGWFKLHRLPVDWHTARLQCYAEGAVLASPLYGSILRTIEDIKVEAKLENIHTGVHSTFSDGVYTSVEGIPLEDLAIEWGLNELNNYNNNQQCLVLSEDGFGVFRCNDSLPYICYRNASGAEEIMNECGTMDNAYTLDERTGSCYKFHSQGETWPTAMRICQAEGGHLAIMNSEAEAQVLKELLAKHPHLHVEYGFSASIGFRTWGHKNSWWTIHGQTVEEAGFAPWVEGEPNRLPRHGDDSNRQSCGTVNRHGLLDDYWCDVPHAFICEKATDLLRDESLLLTENYEYVV